MAAEAFLSRRHDTGDASACRSRSILDFPVTIYYAFKQSERKGDAGITSTGWETFLDAVIRVRNSPITGTWPMRTELPNDG